MIANRHVYSRDELAAAVASSHSWRGVLRALGRSATSAGVQRAVRRQVDALGIDHSHFTGQRRWSDRQLAEAVAGARSWSDVLVRLGLSEAGGGSLRTVRAHATRLGIDTAHLARAQSFAPPPLASEPRIELLRTAAANLAAAWFLLRGHAVLWPLEPCRYDFVARAGESFERVQVKTTTYRDGATSIASIANSRPKGKLIYDVDEIDYFFIIDGDLDAYLIPFRAVMGYQSITLNNYRAYLVAQRGQWLQNPDAA